MTPTTSLIPAIAALLLPLTLATPTSAKVHTITTGDGVRLHVDVEGSGPPCLYVHGGPGSGSLWFQKFSGATFERHFTMVYLDQRGCGRSTSPEDGDYSLARMLADFETVRRDLGYDSWTIAGHSFAGSMMTEYAARHPDRVNGLVMLNATVNANATIADTLYPAFCKVLGREPQDVTRADGTVDLGKVEPLFGEAREAGVLWQVGYDSEEDMDRVNATYGEVPRWNNDLAEKVMQRQEYLADKRPLTARIEAPVLFFYGDADNMAGDGSAGLQFPHLLVWRAHCTHFPFLHANDQIEDALQAYLQQYPSVAGE